MFGITLGPDQVRRAPLEVRRWLRAEIAASLGFDSEPVAPNGGAYLSACTPETAAEIFRLIQPSLPVVNVFFEFGRDGDFVSAEGLVAHRLNDMLRHARLQTMEQLSACLRTIDQAAREASGDAGIRLYWIDSRGYCLVPSTTQRSVAILWSRLMGGPGAATPFMVPEGEQHVAEAQPSLAVSQSGSSTAPQGALQS
jgi:hypothetical protein